MAATFKRVPEHADELRKLASRQGVLNVCSWEPRLAPRSAVLTVAQPRQSVAQQRAGLLEALDAQRLSRSRQACTYASTLPHQLGQHGEAVPPGQDLTGANLDPGLGSPGFTEVGVRVSACALPALCKAFTATCRQD